MIRRSILFVTIIFLLIPLNFFPSENIGPDLFRITVNKLKDKNPKIRREAADKLGDTGNKEATKYLIPLLKDENEYVRQAVARALGKLKDKESVKPLIDSLKDPDINVKAFSIWALGEIRDPRAIEPLASLLLDREEKIRDKSFEALRKFEEPASRRVMVNTLIKGAKSYSLDTHMNSEGMLWKLISLEGEDVVLKALEDPQGDSAKTLRNYIKLMEANIHNVSEIAKKALKDYKDRTLVISELSVFIKSEDAPYASIRLLGEFKDQRGLPILIDTIKNKKTSVRSIAIDAIGDLGNKEAVGILLEILVDPKEYAGTRDHAARALGRLGDKKAVGPLIDVLKNKMENKDVRIGAAVALGNIRDKRAVEPLIDVLKDKREDIWLRVGAVSALGEIGDKRAIDSIQAALKDPSDYVRNAAQSALSKIKVVKESN